MSTCIHAIKQQILGSELLFSGCRFFFLLLLLLNVCVPCVCLFIVISFGSVKLDGWSYCLVLNHDQLNIRKLKEQLKWNDHHHVVVDWNGLHKTVVLAKGIQCIHLVYLKLRLFVWFRLEESTSIYKNINLFLTHTCTRHRLETILVSIFVWQFYFQTYFNRMYAIDSNKCSNWIIKNFHLQFENE